MSNYLTECAAPAWPLSNCWNLQKNKRSKYMYRWWVVRRVHCNIFWILTKVTSFISFLGFVDKIDALSKCQIKALWYRMLTKADAVRRSSGVIDLLNWLVYGTLSKYLNLFHQNLKMDSRFKINPDAKYSNYYHPVTLYINVSPSLFSFVGCMF